MSITKWPCKPSSLEDFINKELIEIIITGASKKANYPRVIIDSNGRKYHAINYREDSQPFCKYLRSQEKDGNELFPGAFDLCNISDNLVVKRFIDNYDSDNEIIKEDICWMGLRDYIIISDTGGYKYAFLSGQFYEWNKDDSLEIVQNKIKEFSSIIRNNYGFDHREDRLLNNLYDNISYHHAATTNDLEEFKIAAKAIDKTLIIIGVDLYKYFRIRSTGKLLTEVDSVPVINKEPDWKRLEEGLELLNEAIGSNFVMLFTEETRRISDEKQNVLFTNLHADYLMNSQSILHILTAENRGFLKIKPILFLALIIAMKFLLMELVPHIIYLSQRSQFSLLQEPKIIKLLVYWQ